MRTHWYCGVVTAFSLVSTSGLGQVPLMGIGGDDTKGVKIEAVACYSELPPMGATPVTFRIENQTDVDRDWLVRSTISRDYSDRSSLRRMWRLAVPAHTTLDRQLTVVIPPTTDDMSSIWTSLSLEIEGYGVFGSGASQSSRVPAVGDQRLTVLTGPAIGAERDHIKKVRGRDVHYLVGAPSCLPIDVRAYLGIDAVWLTPAEVEAMSPPALVALEEHVFLGGQLGIVTSPGSTPRAPFSFTDAYESQTYGLGSLVVVPKDYDDDVPTARILDVMSEAKERYARVHLAGPLLDVFAPVKVRRGVMLLLLIGFAIVIGPFNLLVLARRKNRMRLVWTTPLLSLGAGVMLSAAILLEDGVGGRGLRQNVTLLQPDHHAAHVIQTQTSRTGILLFPDVTTSADTHLDYLPQKMDASGRYRITDDGQSGDWFRTRRRQMHWLHRRVPTRARIELVSGTSSPTIVSSLDAALKTLFFRDAAGFWRANDVRPGATVELEASTLEAFEQWRKEATARSHPVLTELVGAGQEGWFYATAANPSAHMLPTLESLKWEDTAAIWTGPVVRGGEQ